MCYSVEIARTEATDSEQIIGTQQFKPCSNRITITTAAHPKAVHSSSYLHNQLHYILLNMIM